MEIQGLVLGKHWHLKDGKKEWSLQQIQGRDQRSGKGSPREPVKEGSLRIRGLKKKNKGA